MTTPAAEALYLAQHVHAHEALYLAQHVHAHEALYLAQHVHAHEGRKVAFYNPQNKPIDQLPVIYGFNNGGSPGWYSGVLLAESGHGLGGHLCSHEGYMLADLGILEGTRPDRHEHFRAHYPDGYRMMFVSSKDVPSHAGLLAAFERNQELSEAEN